MTTQRISNAKGATALLWQSRPVPSTQYLVLSTFQTQLPRLALVILLLFNPIAIAQESPPSPPAATHLAPKAFRAAAAKIEPSLVRIEGFGGITPGTEGGGYQAPGEGPTTGLVISEGGYILTSTFNFRSR